MPGSPACITARERFDVRDWMGIPFVPHGRSRDSCDCYGLVRLFYVDIMQVRLPLYDRPVTDVHDVRAVGKVMTSHTRDPIWAEVKAPRFGDLIAFGTPHCFYHVGLYLNMEEMLHTRAGSDSTPERWTTPQWRPRLQGFFRYKDFVDDGPVTADKDTCYSTHFNSGF